MFLIWLLLLAITTNSATKAEASNPQTPVPLLHSVPHYKVEYLEKNNLVVDGNLDEESWQRCQVVKDFSCPWETSSPGTAQFRALYDSRFFYFSFNVEDSIGLYLQEKTEMAVVKGDRVEIFFSADTSMSRYYCFEIAPNGNVLDYEASFHRKFNNQWNVQGATIAGKPHAKGYAVEGRIPLSFFMELVNVKSLKGKMIPVGLFRARKKQDADPESIRWYSWIDPHVPTPDFHVPTALGLFEF